VALRTDLGHHDRGSRQSARLKVLLSRHTAFSLLVALIVLVGATSPASASRKWCHRDPVFQVGSTLISVDVAVYEDQQSHVTKPAAVTLIVPPGVSANLVSVDEGFNGLGEVTSIKTDKKLKTTSRGVQVRVVVTVSSNIRMATQVTVLHAALSDTVMGQTNRAVTVNATVYK
jgi:hypothetical protein